jgi:two-component system, NarL family, response regulator DesR
VTLIRAIVAHDGALIRGAIAFVLDAEDDIDVVAEIGCYDQIVEVALANRPHVAILDLDLIPDPVGWSSAGPPGLEKLHRDLAGCNVLVLAEARRSAVLGPMLAAHRPGLGFLAKDGPPERLLAAVRKVAGGEPVLDPDLVVSALRVCSPLTHRETQVLSVAAEGVPVSEVADRLLLSPGTVRNYLSRVIAKIGARSRIEAVRMAQDAGWI